MPSLQFNLKNPMVISLFALVSSFLFFSLVLYLLKPNFVQIIDKNGNSYISNNIIISFSSTFALVTAVTSLVLASSKYGGENEGIRQKNIIFRSNKVNSNFSL